MSSLPVTILPHHQVKMEVSRLGIGSVYFTLTDHLFFAVRPDPGTTWHRILSFNQHANNYLRNLSRGSRVYVEANLEVREPTPDATPGSPQSMRQVFLRHGKQFISHRYLALICFYRNHSCS
jgi:hypothetical protein